MFFETVVLEQHAGVRVHVRPWVLGLAVLGQHTRHDLHATRVSARRECETYFKGLEQLARRQMDGAMNKSHGTRGSRANLRHEGRDSKAEQGGWTARQSKADGQQGTGGHLVDGGHNLEQLVIRHVLEGEGALC